MGQLGHLGHLRLSGQLGYWSRNFCNWYTRTQPLPWRSLCEIPRMITSMVWRSRSWHATTSTKQLFPAERSLLKVWRRQTRQTKNFQLFSWCGFLSRTWKSPQSFSKVLSPTRGMVCTMSHTNLVRQLYSQVNNLGRNFPKQVCYLCGLQEDLHQRDLPNAVTKKIFKGKWTFILQAIFRVCHWRSFLRDGHWNPGNRGNPIYGLLIKIMQKFQQRSYTDESQQRSYLSSLNCKARLKL